MPAHLVREKAIDAALASLFPDDSQARDSWRPQIARALDAANFSPTGDNHHNAALCPHCAPDFRREVDRAAGYLGLAVVSPEVTRDLADQIWEVAEGKSGDHPNIRLKEISGRVRAIGSRNRGGH